MRIAILGAGAWGSALAIAAARQAAAGHGVYLWARDPQQLACLQADRENVRYLPGHRFPDALNLVGGPL
ncbi:MAG: glycerol-3-phosphate dehydrogenase, partial [Burkholderiales bacterium]